MAETKKKHPANCNCAACKKDKGKDNKPPWLKGKDDKKAPAKKTAAKKK